MQLGAVSTARVQLPVKVPADWLPPTDDLNTNQLLQYLGAI